MRVRFFIYISLDTYRIYLLATDKQKSVLDGLFFILEQVYSKDEYVFLNPRY